MTVTALGADPSRWQLVPFVQDGMHRGWSVWCDGQQISGFFEDYRWANAALAEFRAEAKERAARDSDGSPEGGDAKQGSVEDDSAAIAQTPHSQCSKPREDK